LDLSSGSRCGLNLLEPRLVESHTTGIIPFDDRVLFVSLLNCAEFSSRLSEVAQTLDAISGIQFLVGSGGLGEAWLLGTVRVRRCAGVWQWRLESFMQFGYRIIGDMGHIPLFFSKTPEQRPSLRTVHLSIQHKLGKNGSAGPNCTVLTINLAKCGSSLCMRFPIVTITLADVLPMAIVVAVVTITLADVSPVAIVVAVQSIHYNGVCPYPAHLFIDVLAKVGYVKNPTSIFQVCINQVSPEAFEQG
jgi:hypothetical protein